MGVVVASGSATSERSSWRGLACVGGVPGVDGWANVVTDTRRRLHQFVGFQRHARDLPGSAS